MRAYLIVTLGSVGDLYPFMRIAQDLRSLGARVTLATHAYHGKIVRDAGLPYIALGTDEEYLRVIRNPDIWDRKKGFAALFANYGEGLRQILEAMRETAGPDRVIISHPFAVPAAIMARERGHARAVVAAYLAPSNFKSCADPLNISGLSVPRWVPMAWRRALWRFLERHWIDPVALVQLNAVRASLDLVPARSLLDHIATAPDLSITFFPPWFAPTAPDWPRPLIEGGFPLFEQAAPGGLGADVSAFLAAGARPFVFTMGTGNIHAGSIFECALQAVTRLRCRAIFLTPERAQVPPTLPASVLWQAYVPLSMLLPHAAGLVHHGGIGTTAEALRAGTPQLITPFAWDQFDNAARVTALGAGVSIPARRLRPAALARGLAKLRDARVLHARCAALAARLATLHDATVLCQRIEQWVATSGARND